jgi:O-6-methylguanine DNA methyltransferase
MTARDVPTDMQIVQDLSDSRVTAVRTTGIFCRPSCAAAPKPQNTLGYPTAADALFAGYRPCLRCRPHIPDSPRAQRGLRRVALLGRLRRGRRCRAQEGIVHLALLNTPLGPMVAGVVPDGLALLEFSDRPMLETQLKIVERRFHARLEPGRTALHTRVQAALNAYFEGRQTVFDFPMAEPGTPFQETIWSALRQIPAGATSTYAELSESVGRPSAVRATGHANGMNRLAIVVPCHRVVASDGTLGGYGGGIWRKAWLLDHEYRMSVGRRSRAHAAGT